MLNLCVFVFIIYAVSYSAKVILFGRKVKNQSRVCCSARSTTAETNTTPKQRKLSKPSIVKIRQTKAGRKGKSPYVLLLSTFLTTHDINYPLNHLYHDFLFLNNLQ